MTRLQELKKTMYAMKTAIDYMVYEEAKGLCAKATEPEFEYPIFKNNKSGDIYRFTNIGNFEIVYSTNKSIVGLAYVDFTKHTDDSMVSVPYNKERDLYHGQVCYCSNNDYTHQIYIRFYDAISDCSFDYEGKLYGYSYNYYEAVPYEHIPQKMIEAYSSLEGI